MPVENTSREERPNPEAACGGCSYHTLNGALMRAARALLFAQCGETGLETLPFAQVRCLQTVSRTEGRRMQELARELGIKLPALSQIVERLVRQDLLERRADTVDRRVVRLWLTEAARALLDEALQYRERRLRAAVDQMGDEATRRLIGDLSRLAEAGEQAGAGSRRTEGPDPDSADPIAELLAQHARRRRRGTPPTQVD